VGSRSKARECALQALYQLDLGGGDPRDAVRSVLSHFEEADETTGRFADELVRGVQSERAQIDAIIQQSSTHWKLERMARVDRNILRLAIYARVSTEEQREGQTIDSQVSELDRFAREKGWPIVGIYKDEGWSGGVMERPELDRLRDEALRGGFDAVLINDVDRLARDVAHLGVIKRDLERHGIKVIFRKLPSDTSPTSNLMVNILGSFADVKAIDEVHVFLAPKLIGGAEALTPVAGQGLAFVNDALRFHGAKVEQVEGDVYWHGWVE